jgi:hypothetical protein
VKQAKLLVLPLLVAGQFAVTTVPSAGHAATYTVRCESSGNRQSECSVPRRAEVTLQRQTSISPCVEGQSWGYDERRGVIWVDEGCRADFIVDDGRGGGRDRWSNSRFFRCESRNNARAYCEIPWRGDVRLAQQLSITPCAQGQTWGYAGRRQVWVDGGCRADFTRDWNGGDGGWNGPGRGGK